MITIGYGDIHPYTSPEMIFSILAMLLASGVFGYTMNSIMIMFEKRMKLKSHEEESFYYWVFKQKELPINL